MTHALARRLLGALLILEGLAGALWIAGGVARLAIHDAVFITFIIVRGLVGAMQLASGVFLIAGRPAAYPLAIWTLLLSAVLMVVAVGLHLTSSVFESRQRWIGVGIYWAYALGWILILRRRRI